MSQYLCTTNLCLGVSVFIFGISKSYATKSQYFSFYQAHYLIPFKQYSHSRYNPFSSKIYLEKSASLGQKSVRGKTFPNLGQKGVFGQKRPILVKISNLCQNSVW